MTYFFSQNHPEIKAKLRHLERDPLIPQAGILVLAFKLYHQRDEKAHRQKYHMVAKAMGPAPATAWDSWSSKAQRLPCTCYKCGQQGHWVRAYPNPGKPKWPCPRCHQEGHWAVDCPHVALVRGTSLPGNSWADLLGMAMDKWRGLRSLDLTISITSREPKVVIMVCGWPISFLLDTGATYSVLMEFWEPTSPSCSPVFMVGGHPYLPHQTSQLVFLGVFLPPILFW